MSSGLIAASTKAFDVTFATSASLSAGSFGNRFDFPTGTNPYAVVFADLDGDGKPDMIVANSNEGPSEFSEISAQPAMCQRNLLKQDWMSRPGGSTEQCGGRRSRR